MQTIYLDISNRGVIPVIYAKQGDVGRKVEVVLTNSGLPYEPEAGSALSAWFSGASGVGNYTDIGEKSAFSVSGNNVTVELITQMLQNAGEGILCLVLSRANGDQIGLWNIRYICEGIPGAGSEPAKDYYTAFSQAVAGLAYPDASLSVAGKAADAGATGKALDGKAPAGYGWGEGRPASQFTANNVNRTAVFISAGEDMPANDSVWLCEFYATSSDGSGNYGHMVATCQGGIAKGCICYQLRENGVYGEWEWGNPPMVPGVEYRTTERWNGKAVYTKLLELGATVNGEYVYFNIHGIDEMLKAFARIGENPIPYNDGNSYCNIAVAAGACIISCSTDFVGRNVTAQLFYTKK